MKPEQPSSWVEWLVGAALAVQAGLSWLCYPGERDAYTHQLAFARALGWIALLTLCAALCVSPISKLVRLAGRGSEFWTREIRRALGIGAASAGIAHSTLAFVALPSVRTEILETPQLRAGLAVLITLTLLLVTSFPAAVRALRLRSWKELHRLAYPALALAFLHVLHAPYVPLRSALLLLACALLIGSLRVLRVRKRE
jgi:sulfoxide reductase heme-binding subunit YedZ